MANFAPKGANTGITRRSFMQAELIEFGRVL
jgi:hypothetical protein